MTATPSARRHPERSRGICTLSHPERSRGICTLDLAIHDVKVFEGPAERSPRRAPRLRGPRRSWPATAPRPRPPREIPAVVASAHPRTRAPAHPRTRAPAHPRTRAPAHPRTRATILLPIRVHQHVLELSARDRRVHWRRRELISEPVSFEYRQTLREVVHRRAHVMVELDHHLSDPANRAAR